MRKKKTEKGKERLETQTVGDKGMANARLLEKMSDSLKPTFKLSDNGNLKEKNDWKATFDKYINYLKRVADITPGIYYDLFLNNCDVDLQRKLESVKGLKNMGEKRIWQEVEQIYLEINPIIQSTFAGCRLLS